MPGSVISAVTGTSANKKALKAQTNAANSAEAAQLEAFEQNRADLAPYRNAGYAADNQLSYLLGITPKAAPGTASALDAIPANLRSAIEGRTIRSPGASDYADSTYTKLVNELASASPEEYLSKISSYGIPNLDQQQWKDANAKIASGDYSSGEDPFADVNKNLGNYGSLSKKFTLDDYTADPGYQFRLDQGNKAIAANQSAKGNFYSGAALKEANKYNSDMASQEYGSAYDRYNTDQNNLYNRLSGVVNTGIGAANTGVQSAQNNANVLGGIYGQLGNSQANSAITQGKLYNQLGQSLFGSGRSSFSGGQEGGNSSANMASLAKLFLI